MRKTMRQYSAFAPSRDSPRAPSANGRGAFKPQIRAQPGHTLGGAASRPSPIEDRSAHEVWRCPPERQCHAMTPESDVWHRTAYMLGRVADTALLVAASSVDRLRSGVG